VTSQAAEKLYRSLGADTRMAVDLSVAACGWLEYLPQETILFDEARLDRRTRVDIAVGARFLGCEMLVFGRAAHHEQFLRGRLFDRWQIWRDGRLAWSDSLSLDGDIAASLASPFQFGGATALATALYAGADAVSLLPVARDIAQSARGGAVSLIGDILVARFLDASARIVRNDLGNYLTHLRRAAGLTATLPRIWHT
jgi:urease accessory protein